MNNFFRLFIVLLGLLSIPAAIAAPSQFEAGKDYQVTGPKVATAPVVEEFFNYACPGCYSIDNFVNRLKSDNPELTVKLVPIELKPSWKIYVNAYYISEKLGVLEKSHAKLYHRLHVEKKYFRNDDDMKQFFLELGVTEKAYDEVANSYWLSSQVKKARQYAIKHRIGGSPVFLVNQQYKLNNQSLGSLAKIEEAIKTFSGLEK